ncbi:uncharacterized protein LOC127151747 isoform X2 [Cucumis melo]|uniref:Uncharacterized protein LOC127151747 isoform X2 n=1 Tax=Cucumis melo TaxID=3656 RepID=A0ABM3LD10_CUCME|nr:uncharacterized protein LOC127151747 isoform X2 [Cucumis melo]
MGSSVSTSDFNHGFNPFMKVSSSTTIGREATGASSLSKRFRYSSTVDSCLIVKNQPTNVPSLVARNLTSIFSFKSSQPVKASLSSCDRYQSNAGPSKLITATGRSSSVFTSNFGSSAVAGYIASAMVTLLVDPSSVLRTGSPRSSAAFSFPSQPPPTVPLLPSSLT